MKNYYIQYNVGKAKYVVNYHDGEKTHPDGSDFYDIEIFKNKRNLAKYVKDLESNGYAERGIDLNSVADEEINQGESIFDHPVWAWVESTLTPEIDR